MRLITRREAVRWLSSASAGAWLAGHTALKFASAPASGERSPEDSGPSLAPGAPTSPERMALIEAFRKRSEGLQNKLEARTHKSDWEMPYRLFRPEAARGKIPLVVYLHGSGGLGDDNLKQLAFGNIFGLLGAGSNAPSLSRRSENRSHSWRCWRITSGA
jgi:acetyl esterase/lipase